MTGLKRKEEIRHFPNTPSFFQKTIKHCLYQRTQPLNKFNSKNNNILFYVIVLSTWMCTRYISGVCEDQELELQMVVDHMEVLGTESKFSSRTASALRH